MEKISVAESQRFSEMEKALQRHIIGQPEAVEAVSRTVHRAKVGIRDPSRPLSSFLFAGSSGVGKPELAHALAIEYFGSKKSLIRIDMSEYMQRSAVSKFIGSPPGYIGSADGGQLPEAVRQPHSVVLFDEMEKAHRDVLNIMLQVLDDGRLTDNKGKTVNFNNTFIIMTSNVGSDIIARKAIWGMMRQLTCCELKAIVEIMLKELYQRVKAIKINLEVTEKFKEELVRQGNDPAYGARPLKRAIRRLVEDTLAEKILSGAVKEEDNVKMDFDSNGNIVVKQSFVLEWLKKNFRPEFLNKFDELIVFRQLAYSKLKEIVEKFLKQVYERVEDLTRWLTVVKRSRRQDATYGVVLFDEMEKAHRDVLNIMLQVLDDGRLTDNKGKTVNFNNTFIIMTSNVGSDIIAEESHLGYDEVKMKVTEELKKNFKPEFLNRFDELIVFRQLTCCELKAIVEIMLKELYQRVKAIKINLEVTEKFKEELVRQGNDPAYGARPLKRAIRRLVEDTLAEKILSGAVKEEDNVKMDFDSNGNIVVKQSFVLE
ncbi:hypothetical protein Patl1_06451 [Pistacia atlantica]|uniref:Uncharacterized protein n=1 Tax=Pistacia atlantica TaxID=434234 RepID=A0ACC1BQS1_9ROSI|nr:hypothetical protein Patl1_06451 [Pistacia atlantica]